MCSVWCERWRGLIRVYSLTDSGIWTAQHLDSNIPYFPFTSDDINVALESFVRFWTFIIIYQVSQLTQIV